MLIIARAILLPVLAIATGASVVPAQRQYEPRIGQDGKDVIWVPTPDRLVEAMLDLAKVTPGDYVIDLGSGDGRIVIAAARRGARALGIEYNSDMVALSRDNARKEGVSARASFVQGDIFKADFSQATVLTLYLLPEINMKLRPRILRMKPGTRVVSHAFNMGDWAADQTTFAAGRRAFFWIVPARVAGIWTWTAASGDADLKISQTFQKVAGSLRINGKQVPLKNLRLEGARISFAAGASPTRMHDYSGSIEGHVIHGIDKAPSGPPKKWTAAFSRAS